MCLLLPARRIQQRGGKTKKRALLLVYPPKPTEVRVAMYCREAPGLKDLLGSQHFSLVPKSGTSPTEHSRLTGTADAAADACH